jgi:aminopeptidase N
MRIIFTLFLFATLTTNAQQLVDYSKQVKEIALMEQLGHENLSGVENLTSASTNFDVKYYRCEWEVDPAIRFITGKVTVYYIITAAATDIAVDIMSPLIVDSVKQRNNLLTKLQGSNSLQISFAAPVNAGTFDSVSIYYKGVPPASGFGSFIQDQHAGTPVMWSLSEPYGARDWWPCKNGLDDKADSIDIIITAPSQYKAASNGLLQSETLTAGGTKKIAHWKHRYPIATYLICFAVTNYTVFNNSVQLGSTTLPMQTYCYPESLISFQNGTQNVLDAMQLFHNTFGDYPFIKEKYGHVQFGWGGGMEHQTSTFIVSINEGLIVHELAHQWFGDKITCGSWEDIWLNEGFATHLSSFYLEKKYPANIITNRKNLINNITSQPGGSVKVTDTANVGRIFDGRLSYNKGSSLLYMLRWKLTDSVFFKALKTYQQDNKVIYGFARTLDLKRHLEQASAQDLTEFFNDWFVGQGYPSYNVEWTPVGSKFVRIKMSQTTSHPSVGFFEMPVALKFKNATQEKTIVVDNKTNGEIFLKDLGFIADSVFIDPEYWLLSRNNTTTKIQDVVTGQNVVQIYPNPVQNQFFVYLRNFVSPSAVITLFNAGGQRLYTKSINLVNGAEYIEIPSKHLPSGSYLVQVSAGNNFKYVKKLLR